MGVTRVRFTLLPAASVALLALVLPAQAAEPWPQAVEARYKLKFNGLPVGHISFSSKVGPKSYSLTSNGEVSVLFGAFKWTGLAKVAGTVEGAEPAPKSYSFDWKRNKKGGLINLGFDARKATQISVEPPSSKHDDTVPLTEAHKTGVVDPLSAIMALTVSGKGDPCERRARVFDGKQRYDIVFEPKKKMTIPASKVGEPAISAVVCRATYQPVAGHRDNKDSKTYAANRDAEVTLRRVPGSDLMVPHSVVVPTGWGTGSMVVEKIDVTTPGIGHIALTE